MGIFAGFLTVFWFVCIGLYWVDYRTGLAGLDKVLMLEPDKFGSFLSGAFAPVAFFWLAYSVRMQKQELQLQREELAATRVVLSDQQKAQSESAKYAKDLHEATMKQNEIALENVVIEQFRNAINNFYDFCYKKHSISIDGKRSLYLAFRNTDKSFYYNYSCYKIAENINESISYIRENNLFNSTDDDFIILRNLLRLVILIEAITIRHGDISLKEIYNAHGFGVLKNSLTNICNIAGVKNHKTVGDLE